MFMSNVIRYPDDSEESHSPKSLSITADDVNVKKKVLTIDNKTEAKLI